MKTAGDPRGRALRLVVLLVLLGGTIWFAVSGRGRDVLLAARDYSALYRVKHFRDELLFAAAESHVDPTLLAAILYCESSGRVNARSSKDALGLLQLKLATARERADVLGLPEPSERDLLSDARLNIRLGADYFSWLLDRQGGDVERALIAYNAGPTRLAGWIEEAGGYAAWRAGRVAAGDSGVLAYAAKVERYRRYFAEAGLFAPAGSPARPPGG
jgi:soluble lytic murein transglycosylase-like protein